MTFTFLMTAIPDPRSGRRSHGYWNWNAEDLRTPIGLPPEFPEPIEAVRARIVETIGRVTVPHKIHNWHSAIERLLKEDERLRQKQATDPYPLSWEKPRFDSPIDRRRLRILNSLFFAVAKMNGKVSVHGPEARDISISFYQQHLPLRLDRPKGTGRRRVAADTANETSDTSLCLSILESWGSEKAEASWQDNVAQKLELQMTDIAIELIVRAEIKYRERAAHEYRWRVQRKAELEEEERKRKLEAERAEKERQKRIEQGRVSRLLRDAAAFQQAAAIRQYVEAIQSIQPRDGSADLEHWSRWALAQADRIDPALGGKFLNAIQDEEQ